MKHEQATSAESDLREKILKALTDYLYSEGCSCCEKAPDHKNALKRLAQLLDVPASKYGSDLDEHRYAGYDFSSFQSATNQASG